MKKMIMFLALCMAGAGAIACEDKPALTASKTNKELLKEINQTRDNIEKIFRLTSQCQEDRKVACESEACIELQAMIDELERSLVSQELNKIDA